MKNILFLNLTAFSKTGGLEKFNKCFLKALEEISGELGLQSKAMSLHDTYADNRYYTKKNYKGFGGKVIPFVIQSVLNGMRNQVVVLGHINLAIVGVLIKKLMPSKKLILICHGIEVWLPVTGIKKQVLQKADAVFTVSEYTKQKVVSQQNIVADKVSVFHNTIDPYFILPETFGKNKTLLERYGITENDFVIYTLCRLSSKEKYKGYDAVIQALPILLKQYSNIKYLIAGKYDDEEKNRIDALTEKLGVANSVIFAGYIDDEEVTVHYQLADVFIMPSKGEGFGIVFIEAMACGRNTIAGNMDGSIDALKNGELGTLVNPDDSEAIAKAIEQNIVNRKRYDDVYAASLQQKVIHNFGFNQYKQRLKTLLSSLSN